MRKQCHRRRVAPSWVACKLALGKALITPTNDLDLLDQPDADYQALLAGTLDVDGFTRLCEMATSLHVAGELLKQRGVGETKLTGITFTLTGDAAAQSLTRIAERQRATGRFIGTADQYRDIADMLGGMRSVIPVLTRGELIIVLNEAADIVENACRRRAA